MDPAQYDLLTPSKEECASADMKALQLPAFPQKKGPASLEVGKTSRGPRVWGPRVWKRARESGSYGGSDKLRAPRKLLPATKTHSSVSAPATKDNSRRHLRRPLISADANPRKKAHIASLNRRATRDATRLGADPKRRRIVGGKADLVLPRAKAGRRTLLQEDEGATILALPRIGEL